MKRVMDADVGCSHTGSKVGLQEQTEQISFGGQEQTSAKWRAGWMLEFSELLANDVDALLSIVHDRIKRFSDCSDSLTRMYY